MKNLLSFIEDNLYLTAFKTFKQFTKRLKKTGGRNHSGKITVFHRGGGTRKIYRFIDFYYHIWWLSGKVLWLSKDPNRNAFLATIVYENGIVTQLLAHDKIAIFDLVANGKMERIKNGFGGLLKDLIIGAKIFNIEKNPLSGGILSRAAGSFSTIIRKSKTGLVLLRTKRRKNTFSFLNCAATYGIVSNTEHFSRVLQKAGISRWLGIRPTVRGVAMNPIDHPHGGGEGKSKGGKHPVTPWGKLTKGKKTLTLKTKKKVKLLFKRVFF